MVPEQVTPRHGMVGLLPTEFRFPARARVAGEGVDECLVLLLGHGPEGAERQASCRALRGAWVDHARRANRADLRLPSFGLNAQRNVAGAQRNSEACSNVTATTRLQSYTR